MTERFRQIVLLTAALVIGGIAVFVVANWEPNRSVEELAVRWAKPPSLFIEVGDLLVHVRDEGPRDDQMPLVLLHGTGSSLHTWDGLADLLKNDRRVIRFDLPGFGLTGPDPANDYALETYVQFVVDALDTLDVDRCILAGNSLGGYIAWATAVLNPARVEKLVLIDASGYNFESESVPIGFRLARMPLIKNIVQDVLPRSVVESSVNNVYGDPSRVTPELVDRYFELATREGNRNALMERMRQLQPGTLAERITDITQPTLILWGKKDRLIPLRYGEQFQKDIAQSKLVIWEELGHVPHEEDPALAAKAILDFLGAP
jgi:pimeloyl-ACP methyl ester carboxylesterase